MGDDGSSDDKRKDANNGKKEGGEERPKPPKGDGPYVEALMGDDTGDEKDPYIEDMDYYFPNWPQYVIDDVQSNEEEILAALAGGDGNGRRRVLAATTSDGVQADSRSSRHLLLADPISSLGSSGFSYVIVTATSDGVSNNMTMGESSEDAVGASILSRIRAIEVLGEAPTDAQRLDVLWNVLFWSAILLAGVAVLHLAVLVVLRLAKVSRIPKMLHAPRIELLTFTMIVPMIAAAGAAALQSDSAGAIAAGVCFGILLPFGFLIGASVFLMYAVFRPAVEKRRAVYVLSEDSPMYLLPSDDLARTTAIRRQASSDSENGSDEVGDAPNNGTNANANANTITNTSTNNEKRNMLSFLYRRVLSPLFGFESPKRAAHVPGDANISECDAHLQWLGRGKTDGEFVKRYGLFFEDAHGPQVVRVQSRYEWNNTAEADAEERNTVGGAVLVPSVEGATEILQTFAIIFAATKMVLFAVIINAPGGVNHYAQVIALALVSLLHIAYLRICVPYRLRIELMAEIVAAVMDLAVFVCGIILVAVPTWSAAARDRMGLAMIILQAVGFLVFITVRLALALRTCWNMFRFKRVTFGLFGRKDGDEATPGIPTKSSSTSSEGI